MARLTKKQRQELEDYVRYYTDRGVRGVWWDLATAIKTACAEIDGHRKHRRNCRYLGAMNDRAI